MTTVFVGMATPMQCVITVNQQVSGQRLKVNELHDFLSHCVVCTAATMSYW